MTCEHRIEAQHCCCLDVTMVNLVLAVRDIMPKHAHAAVSLINLPDLMLVVCYFVGTVKCTGIQYI